MLGGVNLATVKKDLVADSKADLKLARAAADLSKASSQQLAHPPAGQDKGGRGGAEGKVTAEQKCRDWSEELCKNHHYSPSALKETLGECSLLPFYLHPCHLLCLCHAEQCVFPFPLGCLPPTDDAMTDIPV